MRFFRRPHVSTIMQEADVEYTKGRGLVVYDVTVEMGGEVIFEHPGPYNIQDIEAGLAGFHEDGVFDPDRYRSRLAFFDLVTGPDDLADTEDCRCFRRTNSDRI